MADRNSTNRETESRRILDRVEKEVDSGGASLVSRGARRIRDHMSATDVDGQDAVEKWGTRIGRGVGIVLLVVIVVSLVRLVAGGG